MGINLTRANKHLLRFEELFGLESFYYLLLVLKILYKKGIQVKPVFLLYFSATVLQRLQPVVLYPLV